MASDILEILSPGLQTTVQDLGRTGCGRWGVAPSGALDGFALRVANLLVGNPQPAACLETLLMGLRVRALCDLPVAVTGGDLQPHRGREPFPMWRPQVLRAGEELAFRGPRAGCRAYLAVGGGVAVAPVMGSRSTNLTSGFGGLGGRALAAGDRLPGEPTRITAAAAGRSLDPSEIPALGPSWTLRVIWGPQHEQFTEEGRQALVEETYRVSPLSDRTGIRLEGAPLARRAEAAESIISEGVIAGAIQVPGDDRPIILLNETVTGGYRKIATVIAADLGLLGQVKPGDTVRFEAVSPETALDALQRQEASIARLGRSLGGAKGA